MIDNFDRKNIDNNSKTYIDVSGPEVVEIIIGDENQVWVNVNGVCRFRAYKVREVILEDKRSFPLSFLGS